MTNNPPEKYTNNELSILMNGLSGQIETGFKGVHARQDTTNGKVIENTEFRLKTSATLKTLQWLVGIFGAGTAAVIVSAISGLI